MRRHDATTTVHAPLSTVRAYLADVQRWPEFLAEVREVQPVGHERYRFRLTPALAGDGDGWALMTVRHTRAWRITWHSVEGPEYAGTLHLAAVDPQHTHLRLELEARPATPVAGLTEMVLPRTDQAAHDLRKLAHLLHPQDVTA